jgi:hypothetical protein
MHGTLETLRRAQSDAEKRPSRGEAEQAVRTLIRWAGEHPEREGLLDTPRRVVRAYEEWFKGYDQDPVEILQRTFEDVGGYDEIVVLRDIPFQSCCEHHMAAIQGTVHVGYLPRSRVVGISSSRASSMPMHGGCRSRRGSRPRSPTRSTRCSSRVGWRSSSRPPTPVCRPAAFASTGSRW